MKKFLIILLSVTLFSSHSRKETREDNLLTFKQFPLPVPEQNSQLSQWEKKKVIDSRLIDDMETEMGWKVTGIGEMTYTTDRSKDGKKSLRFRTSLRDEEHYKKNRTEWGSFGGTQGGYDLSQGSWRTAMVTISLMNNLENLQERKDVTELADRIRNEIARGLEWLLKTRFGDGYLILIFL